LRNCIEELQKEKKLRIDNKKNRKTGEKVFQSSKRLKLQIKENKGMIVISK